VGAAYGELLCRNADIVIRVPCGVDQAA
jgi:hypothetical protein